MAHVELQNALLDELLPWFRSLCVWKVVEPGLLRNGHIKVHISYKTFQTWLIINWRQDTNQEKVMLANPKKSHRFQYEFVSVVQNPEARLNISKHSDHYFVLYSILSLKEYICECKCECVRVCTCMHVCDTLVTFIM